MIFEFWLLLGDRLVYRKNTDFVKQSLTLESNDISKKNSIKSTDNENDNLLRLPIVNKSLKDYEPSRFAGSSVKDEEELWFSSSIDNIIDDSWKNISRLSDIED